MGKLKNPIIKMSAFSPLFRIAVRVALMLVLLASIVVVLLNYRALDPSIVDAWIKNAGVLGPILFMLIFAFGTVLLIPGPVFLLVGGALFGPVYGTFYSVTGVMIGAAIAFLIARFVASDWLEAKVGGRLKRLKEGVEQEGWRFVAFLRLVPVFPAIIINYGLGLTRIKFSHFFFASYICKLPTIAAYVYVGHAGLEAISTGENLIPKVLIGMTLIGLVIFLPRWIVKLRRDPAITIEELKSKRQAGEEILLLDVRKAEGVSGEQSRIAGAMEISVDDLEQRLDDLAYYTERPIALFSSSEKMSSKASEILVSNGFAHVRIVKGSMTDLRNLSL